MSETAMHGTTVSFIVLRPPDDGQITAARVEARVADSLLGPGEPVSQRLLRVISDAMGRWVRDDPEGRAFYENTAQDANIGDLLSYFDGYLPAPVDNEVYDRGVYYFKATGLMDNEVSNHWTYDTHIVDSPE